MSVSTDPGTPWDLHDHRPQLRCAEVHSPRLSLALRSHVTVPTHRPARLHTHPAPRDVNAAVPAGEDQPHEVQQHRARRLDA